MNAAIPEAPAERTTYENIETTCPTCGRRCILNRTSDLRTHRPVGGKEVSCTECGMHFWLTSDTVNARYKSLLYDCLDLLENKRYMLSVVGACQSYEMFFALYLRVELVYKPFAAECQTEPWPSIESVNDLSQALRKKVEKRPFAKMRARFLQQVLSDSPPLNLQDASDTIESLDALESWNAPSLSHVRNAAHCDTLKPLLLGVARTTVHELRNRVVHQRGYRPSRAEAENAVNEAKSLLFRLESALALHEELRWYIQKVR